MIGNKRWLTQLILYSPLWRVAILMVALWLILFIVGRVIPRQLWRLASFSKHVWLEVAWFFVYGIWPVGFLIALARLRQKSGRYSRESDKKKRGHP